MSLTDKERAALRRLAEEEDFSPKVQRLSRGVLALLDETEAPNTREAAIVESVLDESDFGGDGMCPDCHAKMPGFHIVGCREGLASAPPATEPPVEPAAVSASSSPTPPFAVIERAVEALSAATQEMDCNCKTLTNPGGKGNPCGPCTVANVTVRLRDALNVSAPALAPPESPDEHKRLRMETVDAFTVFLDGVAAKSHLYWKDSTVAAYQAAWAAEKKLRDHESRHGIAAREGRERTHWPDCAANHGDSECDMGPDCGGPDVLKDIDDLIEHVDENVGVLYDGPDTPELTGKDETIEALREIRAKVRALSIAPAPPVPSNAPSILPAARFERDTAIYLDDMREGQELAILGDDQGDLYVSVRPVGDRMGPSVRLCASGGANHVPGLLRAMRAAREAIRRKAMGERAPVPAPGDVEMSYVAREDPEPLQHEAADARLAAAKVLAANLREQAIEAMVAAWCAVAYPESIEAGTIADSLLLHARSCVQEMIDGRCSTVTGEPATADRVAMAVGRALGVVTGESAPGLRIVSKEQIRNVLASILCGRTVDLSERSLWDADDMMAGEGEFFEPSGTTPTEQLALGVARLLGVKVPEPTKEGV